MKPFADYETTQAAGEFEKLPKGAYEVRIEQAKVTTYTGKDGTPFEKLEIAFDIDKGEYAGYYRRNLEAQQQEDKTWKGVLRIYVPKDDGSEKDLWTKRKFKAIIQAIEDSNPGYHWDWNESGLRGKIVGCIFQWKEWAYNGKSGWFANPYNFIDVAKVRSGEFKLPDDKPLPENQKPVSPNISAADESEDDFPF